MNKKFISNVLSIVKHDNIRIGDFEKKHGLSKGYLSRVANGSRSGISLEKAIELSEALDSDVYEILNTDWNKTFEEEDRKAEIVEVEKKIEEMKKHLEELKDVQ